MQTPKLRQNEYLAYITYNCSRCGNPTIVPLKITLGSDNPLHTEAAFPSMIATMKEYGIPAKVFCEMNYRFSMGANVFTFVFFSDRCPACGNIEPWIESIESYNSLSKNDKPVIHRDFPEAYRWVEQEIAKKKQLANTRRNVPELFEEAKTKVITATKEINRLFAAKNSLTTPEQMELERKTNDLLTKKSALKAFDFKGKKAINNELKQTEQRLNAIKAQTADQIKVIDGQIEAQQKIIKEYQAIACGFSDQIFEIEGAAGSCYYFKINDIPSEWLSE